MHRLHDLSELPEDLGPCVVTVGNFDGVHRGHQEVLGMVVERAQREGASSVVLTFDPHPALVHRPDQYRGQIMGTSDKLDAMEQLGVDAVLVQHYDLAFASQTFGIYSGLLYGTPLIGAWLGDRVLGLVSYAWAGFGAAFGPRCFSQHRIASVTIAQPNPKSSIGMSHGKRMPRN